MTKIAIVGIGRAGGALALALRSAGMDVGPLVFRGSRAALAGFESWDLVARHDLHDLSVDVVIVATADDEIRSAAGELSRLDRIPPVALHLSGSLSSEELDALRVKGVAVGSMHPLVSISDPELGARRFAGAYFCIEGDSDATVVANEIVSHLGGVAFSIETSLKPLYHASAVMASGHVVTLFDAAVEMLCKCGLDRDAAQTALLPLLQSTVENLRHQSPADALTGPFIRGDEGALRRHLISFEGQIDNNLVDLYLTLAERSIRLGSPSNMNELLDSISVAKRKTGC